MKIPISNVYYLLCYACGERVLDSKDELTGATAGPESLIDLLALVLIRRLKRFLRRGLDRNYLQAEEETTAPKGRIAFGASVVKCSVRRQALVCRQDDLDVNVLQNQILRTTLHYLANQDGVDKSRRIEAAKLERLLHLVAPIPLSLDVFKRVQLHRNNAGYRFLLAVCKLIWLGLLPDAGASEHSSAFEGIRNDDHVMRRIFEEFIGNFYALEVPSLKVSTQQRLNWDVDLPSDVQYLPVMRADAVLRSKRNGLTLVADAKYYAETLASFHNRERVRSAHLYQITAYLRSAELKTMDAEGLLIYPQSEAHVSANFTLSRRRVRVRTVDLSNTWHEIHSSLCSLVSHMN